MASPATLGELIRWEVAPALHRTRTPLLCWPLPTRWGFEVVSCSITKASRVSSFSFSSTIQRSTLQGKCSLSFVLLLTRTSKPNEKQDLLEQVSRLRKMEKVNLTFHYISFYYPLFKLNNIQQALSFSCNYIFWLFQTSPNPSKPVLPRAHQRVGDPKLVVNPWEIERRKARSRSTPGHHWPTPTSGAENEEDFQRFSFRKVRQVYIGSFLAEHLVGRGTRLSRKRLPSDEVISHFYLYHPFLNHIIVLVIWL
jgi:hypothetical protein